VRVYLVRHGETEWSRDRRFCGTSDPPLTEHGEGQARALARRLLREPIGRIFTSPRVRATRTAAVLADALGLPMKIVPLLRETGFGRWEGLTREEIAARFPKIWGAWQTRPDVVSPPAGETALQTWGRAERAFREILLKNDRASLVVAHRTLNRIYLSRVLGLPLRHYRRLEQDETCLNILEVATSRLATSLVCLNDSCHLRDLDPGGLR
jgi:phosphoserine phosphatase